MRSLPQRRLHSVEQVIIAVGRSADADADGMTSERVDAGGVANIAAAAAKHLCRPRFEAREVQAMRTAEDLAQWQRLDDVIMVSRRRLTAHRAFLLQHGGLPANRLGTALRPSEDNLISPRP